MFRFHVQVLAIFAACSLAAAQPTPVWTHTYGGSGMDRGWALCNAPGGGVMVTGLGQRAGCDYYEPFTLRTDAEGDSIGSNWYPVQLQDSAYFMSRAIIPTMEGGFAMAGCYYTWMRPCFLTKMNSAGDTLWTNFYFTTGMDLRGLVQTSDSGFVMTGTWFDPGFQSPDVYIFKTDANGTLLWYQTYGGPGEDSAMAVVNLPDQGLAVCGSKQLDFMSAYQEAYLIRTNSEGDTLWTHVYGGSTYNSFVAMDRTFDHGYILGGVSDSLDETGSEHVYLVRADSAGSVLWQKHLWLQGTDHTCGINSIKQQPDGGFIAVGWTHPISQYWNYDAFVIKFNSSGDTVWTHVFGSQNPWGDRLKAVVLGTEGGFYAAGYWGSQQGQTDDIFVVRYAAESGLQGTVRDQSNAPVANVRVDVLGQTLSALTDATGHYMFSLPAGEYNLAVSGPCISADTALTVTVPFDSIGVHDWSVFRPDIELSVSSLNLLVYNHHPDTTYFTAHNTGEGSLGISITATTETPPGPWLFVSPASGQIPAGDSLRVRVRVAVDTSGHGVYEYQGTLHVRSNSCPDSAVQIIVQATVRPDAVESADHSLPSHFELSAYPNPFNPVTTLSVAVPQRTRLKLALYDVTGRRVKTLCDGMMDAGVHSVPVNGSTLPSGLYFARMESSGFTRTQKLMLLK